MSTGIRRPDWSAFAAGVAFGFLRGMLDPQPGERILEIGPGDGRHAVEITDQLAPGGRLDVVDSERATSLPYGDATFEAAYLMGGLGELSDPDAVLQELSRVLRDGGRLVVAETAFDPDFVPLDLLRRHGERAGFAFERRAGAPGALLACFRAARARTSITTLTSMHHDVQVQADLASA
ncbi:MAG: class I SAM-dependent methyltransferase [Actinomycetota bacterium]